MKKTLTVAALFVMVVAMLLTAVYASTVDSLANDLYSVGSQYGMTEGQKNQVEMVIKEAKDLTDAKCEQIVAYAHMAAAMMDEHEIKNVEDLKKAPEYVKEDLKWYAIAAGEIAGVNVTFTTDGTFEVYNAEGKLITTFTNPEKAAYTGNM